MSELRYPSVGKIIEYNILAVTLIKAKKADTAKVLSRAKIEETLAKCRRQEGDVYDKAAVLLRGLVQRHPFASGNRRTAFLVVKEFIVSNGGRLGINDDPARASAFQGIREGYYTHEEMTEWIKHGSIRSFR